MKNKINLINEEVLNVKSVSGMAEIYVYAIVELKKRLREFEQELMEKMDSRGKGKIDVGDDVLVLIEKRKWNKNTELLTKAQDLLTKKKYNVKLVWTKEVEQFAPKQTIDKYKDMDISAKINSLLGRAMTETPDGFKLDIKPKNG